MSFEFDLRLTEADPSGYYYPRWDQAQKITVTADTLNEAIKKATIVMGKTRNHGWKWRAVCDSIREVP